MIRPAGPSAAWQRVRLARTSAGLLLAIGALTTGSPALVSVLAAPSASTQLKAEPRTDPPPADVTGALRSRLSSAGQVVTGGPATLEFWWVESLPVDDGAAPGWSRVAEGSFIGVVRVAGSFKEIRGKTVKPGVYTLRLGLQPQNGDHLGASPYREYLLLSPAAADTDPNPLGFDGAVALAKQTTGTSHPGALSLDPPVSTAAVLSAYTTEPDLQGVTFEVATAPKGSLRFGLILVGLIEH